MIASGTSIPQTVMDEYLVMRLSELVEEGIIDEVDNRALRKWSRESFQRNAEAIRQVLLSIPPRKEE